MRGLGFVPVKLIQEALQNIGRGGPIVNPFSASDYAFLTHGGDSGNPDPYWQRIRGANVYGPGAAGNYAWQNDPSQWQVSPEGTELLNLNRDIIRNVPVFSNINWNDPRMRFPESFMPTAAATPVPEIAPAPAAPPTPAPSVAPPASSPVFTGTYVSPAPAVPSGYSSYTPGYSSEPMDMPTEGAPQVQKAGLLSNLPPWALPLIAIGLAMPIILGKTPGAPRRRRR